LLVAAEVMPDLLAVLASAGAPPPLIGDARVVSVKVGAGHREGWHHG